MAIVTRAVGRSSVAALGLMLLVGTSASRADSLPRDRGRSGDCDREKPVVVVNGADAAVPVWVVGREAVEPFQHEFALDWPDGEGLVTGSMQVPPGKRLVIEYASLSAYLPADGQSMFVRIITTAGGGSAFHTLAVQKQEDYGVLKQFGAAHSVRIYAEAGTTVQVSAGRVPFSSTASGWITLSGHFESAP